jgi:uncharacterized protein (TIGR00369 family)
MSKSIFKKMLDGDRPWPKAALTLGARIIDVDIKSGAIEVEFEAKDDFTNPLGNIQGGFLVAMLDDTMASSIMATLGENEYSPTLELKTNFIAPVNVGKVYGYGRIISKGRSICVLEGELKQNDKLVAHASATALIRKTNK